MRIPPVFRALASRLNLNIQRLTIRFLAEGTWNRSFPVSDYNNRREYVFRVSLPVYPWYKTQAEVGVIQYIRRHTRIPAPVVYAVQEQTMIQPRRRPIGHPHQGLLPSCLRVTEAPFSPIIPVNRIVGSSFEWTLLQPGCQSM